MKLTPIIAEAMVCLRDIGVKNDSEEILRAKTRAWYEFSQMSSTGYSAI